MPRFRPCSGGYDFVCARCNGMHEGKPCADVIEHEGVAYKVVSIAKAAKYRMTGRVKIYDSESGILPVSSMPIIGRLFVMKADDRAVAPRNQ